jgi:hypothetical protein
MYSQRQRAEGKRKKEEGRRKKEKVCYQVVAAARSPLIQLVTVIVNDLMSDLISDLKRKGTIDRPLQFAI